MRPTLSYVVVMALEDRPVSMRVPAVLMDEVRAAALELERSVSWVLRRALRDWLDARSQAVRSELD
jgi:predicted transcriptional regulator